MNFNEGAGCEGGAVQLIVGGDVRRMRGGCLPSSVSVAYFPDQNRLAQLQRALAKPAQAVAVPDSFEIGRDDLDIVLLD